jgi:endonuclease YncB( thermonuclease family)
MEATVPAVVDLIIVLAIAMPPMVASAEPIAPAEFRVVDGDTIGVAGEAFRSVGFDAPETYRAR